MDQHNLRSEPVRRVQYVTRGCVDLLPVVRWLAGFPAKPASGPKRETLSGLMESYPMSVCTLRWMTDPES